MTQPAKYLFDRCFSPVTGRGAGRDGPERRPPEFDRELAEARAAAFEQGRAAGETAARAALEGQLAMAATALAERAEQMMGELTRECEAIQAQAVQVGLTAAERLAREFLRREPEAEIEAVFADCAAHVTQPPHIAVRVAAALAEPLRDRLAAIAAERGFTGRVTVAGDADLAPGDCCIDWAEGGVARDFDTVRARIEDVLARHLAARAPLPSTAPDANDRDSAAGERS